MSPEENTKKSRMRTWCNKLLKACKPYKIYKDIERAIDEGDNAKIVSTLLSETGDVIDGNVGNAMHCARDLIYISQSDTPLDSTAHGINAALKYADLGESGNTFAHSSVDYLHSMANMDKYEKRVFDHIKRQTRDIIQKNCRESRQRYEAYMRRFEYAGMYKQPLTLELDKSPIFPGMGNMDTQLPLRFSPAQNNTLFNPEMSTSAPFPNAPSPRNEETADNNTEEGLTLHTPTSQPSHEASDTSLPHTPNLHKEETADNNTKKHPLFDDFDDIKRKSSRRKKSTFIWNIDFKFNPTVDHNPPADRRNHPVAIDYISRRKGR